MRDKKMINKWSEIKKTIKSRPVLAYLVKIPIEKWNEYMTSTPEDEEINRIHDLIIEDRTQKTARLKEELSKLVGYRELAQFSKKTMVSTASIKDIIENKKVTAGYDVINKLEIFINAINPEFEISIENTMDSRSLVDDEFKRAIHDIELSTRVLNEFSYYLLKIGKNLKNDKSYYNGNPIKASSYLDRVISILTSTKEKIDIIDELYLDK